MSKPDLRRPGDARVKAQLDALYRELPAIECQRKCDSSCGPIFMSRVEWSRITKKLGYAPRAASLTCPMLCDGLCAVYTIRPMICRLWGISEGLECPWGCQLERYLTRAESFDLLLRAELLSEPDRADEIEAQRAFIRERPELVNAIGSTLTITPRIDG